MYFVREQYSRGRFEGVNKVAAVIDADTASDLPEYNNCKGVDGELTLGTIAFVADEVAFYALTSDGEWHKQGEESNSNKPSLNSVSPMMIKSGTNLSALPDMSEDAEPLEEMSDEDAELL